MPGQDEIIIIEEGFDDLPPPPPPPEDDDEAAKKKKKILIISAAAAAALLLVAGVTAAVLLSKHGEAATPAENNASTAEKPSIERPESRTDIEQLIQKANLLYQKGDKDKALAIFEEISQYNDAVSQYNLGVAKMKEGNFADALLHFQHALDNNERKCPAALNAAVCAYKLCDAKKFTEYLNLARDHLPDEVDSPLYSYYYALVHYYGTHYYETLAALNHPTSDAYAAQNDLLKARIAYLFGDAATPIKLLAKTKNLDAELPIGLLYAQQEDYDAAMLHLTKATKLDATRIDALSALALVQIKAGLYKAAAVSLTSLQNILPPKQSPTYSIHTILKPSLFDIDAAQNHFRKHFLLDQQTLFPLIFYFAPYKIFNPDQTIVDIRKGEMGLLKDETTLAKAYLANSSMLSKANGKIAQAIRLATAYHLDGAYRILSDVEQTTPRHSILQYNLGLVLAQMGNYPAAYAHFQRAYNLDPKNALAGIMSLLTANLTGDDAQRTVNALKADLFGKTGLTRDQTYLTALLYYLDNNFPASAHWIGQNSDDRSPLVQIIKILAGTRASQPELTLQGSRRLTELLPDDLMARFLSLVVTYKNDSTKTLAAAGQQFFRQSTLDWSSLYYGPAIVRETIVPFAFVAGMTPRLEQQLNTKLLAESAERITVAKALAQSDIHLQRFAKADAIYRQLIDEKKIFDSRTLFLAAVATMGNNHNGDAIGFLDLAKMGDPKNDEARFGLALLHLEAGNLPVAIKAFQSLDNDQFVSSYFDFVLDTTTGR